MTRSTLAFKTFSPFEVYLALLSEEARFLPRHCGNDLPEPPDLRLLFNEQEQFFSQIKAFRNDMLHPKKKQYGVLVQGMARNRFDLQTDYVQRRLDSCMDSIRCDLRMQLEVVINTMPDAQTAFWRFQSLRDFDKDFARVEDPISIEGIFHPMNKMAEEHKELPENYWQPNEHEAKVGTRLGQALSDTYPYNPVVSFSVYDATRPTHQSPLADL